jgi:uncharacterized membrane protein YtjA (UPF0391 family)
LFRARAQFSPDRAREPFIAASICSAMKARATNTGADTQRTETDMLGWVVTFLIVALIAGILGFGGIAGASIEIAKIIFVVALVLFLVSAIFGIARGRRL